MRKIHTQWYTWAGREAERDEWRSNLNLVWYWVLEVGDIFWQNAYKRRPDRLRAGSVRVSLAHSTQRAGVRIALVFQEGSQKPL